MSLSFSVQEMYAIVSECRKKRCRELKGAALLVLTTNSTLMLVRRP